MTSAVDPDYIRCVSVAAQRCPSGASVRSTLSTTPFNIQRNRPKTAAEVATSARSQAQRILNPDRSDMLDELMFLYGRGVSGSFHFGSAGNSNALMRTKTCMTSSQASPWTMYDSASLQMYRASSRFQRRRTFPQLFNQPLVRQKTT